MKKLMIDLINRYWKFDDDQQHVSTWHDKQNFISAIEQLSIQGVMQPLPKRLSNAAYLNAREMKYEDFVKWWDEQV